MTESVPDASISRQNSSSELTPQTTLNPATCNQPTPQSAISPEHKIPSRIRPSESVDAGFDFLATIVVDKEVDQ